MALKFYRSQGQAKTGFPAVLAWAKHKLGLEPAQVATKSELEILNFTDFSDGVEAIRPIIDRIAAKNAQVAMLLEHVLSPGMQKDDGKGGTEFVANPYFVLSPAAQKEFHRVEVLNFPTAPEAAEYCTKNGVAFTKNAPAAKAGASVVEEEG